MEIQTLVEPLDSDAATVEGIRQVIHLSFPSVDAFAVGRDYRHKHRPDDVRIVARDGERIAAHIAVHWATGQFAPDGPEGLFGCIGCVCSHPDYRGQRLADACMRRALAVMAERNAIAGLLFCGPAVLHFYTRFGYAPYPNEVLLTRDSGELYRRNWRDWRMAKPLSPAVETWPRGELTLDAEDF